MHRQEICQQGAAWALSLECGDAPCRGLDRRCIPPRHTHGLILEDLLEYVSYSLM